MENKKQLVIVPPMSEPLQKLNVVLEGIAVEEDIEISVIDDPKELQQFMGSSGQCLVLFSNAKKCANFFQDNKVTLLKTHSKVILLTAKEIPQKTLAKFVKVGLTEAILENTPPKTLLYKVKLQLRSIKSSIQKDEKDQVVKSLVENDSISSKQDQNYELNENLKITDSLSADEIPKNKKESSYIEVEQFENLSGKKTIQEEAIETHWKSKRQTNERQVEIESDANKIKNEESDIDMYYRKKKSKLLDEEQILEDASLIRKSAQNPDNEEEVKKNKKLNIEIDLEKSDSKRKNKAEEEVQEENLILKIKKEQLNIDLAEKKPKLIDEDFSEKENDISKELEEIEAFMAEAKKRQSPGQEEDLGGYLKGKILNNEAIQEEENDLLEKKEYDNSELNKKGKLLDLELENSNEDKNTKNKEAEEDSENNPHEGQVDQINLNMFGESSSTDRINDKMVAELGTGRGNLLKAIDNLDLDPKVKTEDEASNQSDKHKKIKLEEVEDEDLSLKDKDLQDNEAEKKERKKSLNLLLESDENEEVEKISDQDVFESNSKQVSLQEEINEKSSKELAPKSPEEESNIAYKKLNQINLVLDKNKEEKSNQRKVDKIDTHYRGGAAKEVDNNWDNLVDNNRDVNVKLEKKQRQEDLNENRKDLKDYGETTIDYRKLKEEFSQMSRGETSSKEYVAGEAQSQALKDTEDQGTFQVIEVEACGFDFGINVLNLIHQKDSKPIDFYKMVSEELITNYKAYPVFYNYKPNSSKHVEVFDSFMYFGTNLVSNDLKEWWSDLKNDSKNLEFYSSKSMTTWLCREIEDKTGKAGQFWEDVELPQWAENELTNKKVELIFPYFDGVDRMGLAVAFFPSGITPKQENSLIVTLEMVRTIFLNSIERKSSNFIPEIINGKDEDSEIIEKKTLLNRFAGFFNRKKVG